MLTPSPQTINPAPGSAGALSRLQKRFVLVETPITLGEITLLLPELAKPEEYIQVCLARGIAGGGLPYWTKIWPASIMLASLVANMPLKPGDKVMELGAGMGLPGLVAAGRGCKVLLTDLDHDALEFARAAAELNGLGDIVSVRSLDWSAPPDDLGEYSTILAAEILYRPGSFDMLAGLLRKLVHREVNAYLSHQKEHMSLTFFNNLGDDFIIRQKTQILRGDEPAQILLHNLRRNA